MKMPADTWAYARPSVYGTLYAVCTHLPPEKVQVHSYTG